MVRKKDNGELFTVAPPLSRGTLEQIYLSLRLALVEHLELKGESLPLFFDETLINWDSSRLDNGLKLLKEISANRQIFLFTCHSWLVDAILKMGEAQVIQLDGK